MSHLRASWWSGSDHDRGAYCAAVITSLLDIPLELSPGSPAKAAGLTDLYTGLAGYVRRCKPRYTPLDLRRPPI